jgi:hypothetical protein
MAYPAKHPRFIRAAAAILIAAAAVCANAAASTIQNDTFWKDTSGTPIYSQGGGMLKVDGRYYWYGVKYAEAVSYARQPGRTAPTPHFDAITVYSSTDLVNWRFEGDAIKAGAAGERFAPNDWVGRLGVVFNPTTKKYVLITQYGSKNMGSGVLFATSDTPAGPFTYAGIQARIDNVSTPGTGDQTVFVDDDGKPYLVFSNAHGRRNLYVAALRSSDYLQVEPAVNIYNAPAGGREGNAMFKYQGVYYFCSSDLHGWNASRTYYMSAQKITGPYSAEKLIQGTDADFSHVSQNGFFIPVQGSEATTILFAGDRWSDFAGNGIGYNIWVPLSFTGTVPVFHSLSQFDLDATRGTWTLGKQNNYVLNPGFEADRVKQTSVAGWVTSWTSLGASSPIMNVLDGHTGRWALSLDHQDYGVGSAVQNIVLPNGSYTLKAWVRSSGGQSVAKLYALADGADEMAHALTAPLGEWTEVSIPHIVVKAGAVKVGAYSEGRTGQWLHVDDVSLVRE